jgi:hypothetical protein
MGRNMSKGCSIAAVVSQVAGGMDGAMKNIEIVGVVTVWMGTVDCR